MNRPFATIFVLLKSQINKTNQYGTEYDQFRRGCVREAACLFTQKCWARLSNQKNTSTGYTEHTWNRHYLHCIWNIVIFVLSCSRMPYSSVWIIGYDRDICLIWDLEFFVWFAIFFYTVGLFCSFLIHNSYQI